MKSFALVDAETDEELQEIQNGDYIELPQLPHRQLSIKAITEPEVVGSVAFSLEGPLMHEQTDNEAPYTLFGDQAGDFSGRILPPGEYKLVATPYKESMKTGTVGSALQIKFTIATAHVNVQWEKTIGGNSYDYLTSTIPTVDGGYLLSGFSHSNASVDKSEDNKGGCEVYDEYGDCIFFGSDYWIVKTDASGNKLWEKTIGGNSSDILTSTISIPDGGYLLAGTSESDASGDNTEYRRGDCDEFGNCWSDHWVVKIDEQGNKIWDKTLGGNSDDALSSS